MSAPPSGKWFGKIKKDKQTGIQVLDENLRPVYTYYIEKLLPIKSGEEAWFMIFKSDCSQRSNLIKATGIMPASRG